MTSLRRTYGAALQVTMRNTAAAYGYTLSTAAALNLLIETSGKPDAGKLFLFAIGGVLAFALLEAFLAALGSFAAESPEQAFPFAAALTFLASWLTGSQKQILADSFATFVGHPAYDTSTLCADLHRFAFLLGASDGEELFGEPTP